MYNKDMVICLVNYLPFFGLLISLLDIFKLLEKCNRNRVCIHVISNSRNKQNLSKSDVV